MRIRSTAGNITRKLVIAMLLLNLFSGMLIDYNPAFELLSIIYLCIGLLSVVLFIVFSYKKFSFNRTTTLAVLFLIWSLMSFWWSSGGLYYLLDRYRYFVIGFSLFWMVKSYFKPEYSTTLMNVMFIALIIDAFFTVYQNEIVGLHPDFCNGIFGTYDYFNSSQGVLCLLVSILSVMHYIYKTWNREKCLLSILLSFVICAFSEVKAFYVLFLMALFIIVMLQINDKRLRRRIIRIILIALLAAYVAWQILLVVMPENLKFFTNLSLYLKYEDYGARGGAGRTNGFSYVFQNVFDSNIFTALVGKGIGSASGQYVYEMSLLLHEEGIVGLFLLGGFLISCAVDGLKLSRNRTTQSAGVFLVVWSFCVIVSLLIWNAIFAKPMPFVFIFLAIGYVGIAKKNNGI